MLNPIQIVQIDQDLCCKEYGTTNACGTCNATATNKCYNTFATCKSVADYSLGDPLTLSFTQGQSDQPDDIYAIPSLLNVSTQPAKINVGSRAGREAPLGRRPVITITLQDHAHSDFYVDPYLADRTFNPMDRSTFWSKWLTRNPYFFGRPLRLIDGYVGEAVGSMSTRNYIIDKITLPDSKGVVTITATDALLSISDDKQQCPRLSTGRLISDITSGDTSIAIEQGDLADYNSYPTNLLRINDEIITYTGITDGGSGLLTFTGCTRGTNNTTADAQKAGDTVQACMEYTLERPDTILIDLLETFGDLPAAAVDETGIVSEGDTWLNSYTASRIISAPTGVTQLIGELCEQSNIYVWWDDEAAKVKAKVISPAQGTVPLVTDADNIIQNSVSIQEYPDQRASEVWVSYIPRTPIADEKETDYRRTNAIIDSVSSSAFSYGARQVYNVIAKWIDSETVASLLAYRMLLRFSSTPQQITFSTDIKDDFALGDIIDINTSQFVDESGERQTIRHQIISKKKLGSSVVQYVAMKYEYSSSQKYGFYTVDAAPIYSLATDAEKATGAWWAEDDGTVDGVDFGYSYI